jgi:hypothetical protein
MMHDRMARIFHSMGEVPEGIESMPQRPASLGHPYDSERSLSLTE